MYLEYNEYENTFTWEELRHVSGAMGFPKDLFEKNLPKEYTVMTTGIHVKDLLKCIKDRYFHVDLHYTVNLKAGAYNASCLKKAIQFVSKRFLSFKELLDVRLAFQAYEEYDQKGMKIDEYTFLRTLKMCGRVISPKKLMHKLKHIRSSYVEQGRIQFFEFLDLLALCELSEDYDITYDLHSPVEKTWAKLYKIDDFNHFTIPMDKKLWKHLNKEYKDKELNCYRPELVSARFVKSPLQSEDFRTRVKLSNLQYETLHRSLRNSNKQVQLAKGGFTYARPQQYSKECVSKRAMSASTGKVSSMTTPRVLARSSTPVSMRDDAVPSPSARPKKAQRPQSSPPVMSERLLKASKAKVDNARFDICTEKQRWSEHYFTNISSHLPNYPEVLRRMRKPSPMPRRKRIYRRERPSPSVISRLANHETSPPTHHTERCDALVHGTGTDQHSLALRKKARKIRCKSAPAAPLRNISASSTRPKGRSKYSSLLESLMNEYGYVSDDQSSENEESTICEDLIAVESAGCNIAGFNAIENNEAMMAVMAPSTSASSEEDIPEHESESLMKTEVKLCTTADLIAPEQSASDSEKKQKIIDEYLKWRNGKRLRMKELIETSGYYRTCVNPNTEIERPPPSLERTAKTQIDDSKETVAAEPIREITDFERHVLDPDNLRIPHDVCLVDETEDFFEKMRKLKALKRIAQRYPAEDRRWFMSLVRTNQV